MENEKILALTAMVLSVTMIVNTLSLSGITGQVSKLEQSITELEPISPLFCGDRYCEPGENPDTCPMDCLICGDGTCWDVECGACDEDCVNIPGCSRCGNGICSGTDDCINCPQDCGICPMQCGNGICEHGEGCTSCSRDCGDCTGGEDEEQFPDYLGEKCDPNSPLYTPFNCPKSPGLY